MEGRRGEGRGREEGGKEKISKKALKENGNQLTDQQL